MAKKYRRQTHHRKKQYSEKELSRKAWREEKKLLRDKSKRLGIVGFYSDGVPPWVKRYCNKKHRQWERQRLVHEKYDELGGPRHKRRDIFDPWTWF